MGCLHILQINIDRGREAHDLLIATMKERDTDVVLLGECNVNRAITSDFWMDHRKDAAIGINRNKVNVDRVETLRYA